MSVFDYMPREPTNRLRSLRSELIYFQHMQNTATSGARGGIAEPLFERFEPFKGVAQYEIFSPLVR